MNKKIMLVALMLLAILTIGAVSASDDADNLTAAEMGGDELDVGQTPLDDEILSEENNTAVGEYDDDGNVLYSVEFYHEVNIDRGYADLCSYGFSDQYTGTVAIRLNGSEVYNETVVANNFVWLDVDDLGLEGFAYGKYNVDFIYSGDQINDNFTISDTIELTYTFNVYTDYDSVCYGKNVLFDYYLPYDGDGTFSCIINGKEYILDDDVFVDGMLEIPAEWISYGENNITFKYEGENYPLKTVNCSLTCKAFISVPESIPFNETLFLTVNLPDDANDYLEIYEVTSQDVDMEDFEKMSPSSYCGYTDYGDYVEIYNLTLLGSGKVNNGVGNVSVSCLPLGTHVLCLNYTGRYDLGVYGYGANSHPEFEVDVTPIIILKDRVWIDGQTTGKFILPEKYNGILTIEIGDESRQFDVIKGNATFELFNLDYQDYWDDDPDYKSLGVYFSFEDSENHYEFQYGRLIKVMFIKPQSEPYPDQSSPLIVKDHGNYFTTVFITESAKGDITVYVDDEYYGVFGVLYGEAYVDIDMDNLTLGKHDLRFEYSGDDYYTPATFNDSFTLTHVDFLIPEEVTIGKYYMDGYDNNAYVIMTDDATGEVKLFVDDVEIETKQVKGIETSISLSNLTYGNHTVSLIYQNGNYPSSNRTSKVEAKYEYGLTIRDLVYGREDAYVTLPIGATGTVKAKVGDKEFTATVNENGIAKFDINGIPAGTYPTTVTYAGDGKYPADSKTFDLTIEYRIISNMVDYDPIYVDNLTNYKFDLILPENATGKLVVYNSYWDDPNLIMSKELVNGKAQITLAEALESFENKIGSFDLAARYVGEDYDVYGVYRDIIVNGYVLSYPENLENIPLGGTAVYTIKLSGNHTGYLRVLEDNRFKTVVVDNIAIVDGIATISIPATSLGSKYFILSYVGEDVKLEIEEIHFIVAPKNVTLSQEAVDGDVLFTVEMPDDASGVLTAYMSSVAYSGLLILESNYTGSIATITASDIHTGKWVLSSFVINDEKYGRYNFETTSQYYAEGYYGEFKILKNTEPAAPLDANLTATANDIKQGNDAVIEISINSNISGKVFVGNDEVTINDGKGIFKIPNLSAGTYTYTVSFDGDSTFMKSNVTVSFKVSTDPKITAKDISVLYKSNGKYSVTVYGTDGKLAKNIQVIFKINGKQVGKGNTDSNGVATYTVVNVPGTYKIAATALGVSSIKTLKVKHLLTLKTATLKKSAKKLTLQATLAKVNGKSLKNKKITFKINGKKVATAKTNNKGVAKITIKNPNVVKKLKAGKKVTYQATYLKDTVKKTTKIKK